MVPSAMLSAVGAKVTHISVDDGCPVKSYWTYVCAQTPKSQLQRTLNVYATQALLTNIQDHEYQCGSSAEHTN